MAMDARLTLMVLKAMLIKVKSAALAENYIKFEGESLNLP